MTVSVARFESQLKKFKEGNSPVIPLRQLVDSLLKKTASLPPFGGNFPWTMGIYPSLYAKCLADQNINAVTLFFLLPSAPTMTVLSSLLRSSPYAQA